MNFHKNDIIRFIAEESKYHKKVYYLILDISKYYKDKTHIGYIMKIRTFIENNNYFDIDEDASMVFTTDKIINSNKNININLTSIDNSNIVKVFDKQIISKIYLLNRQVK